MYIFELISNLFKRNEKESLYDPLNEPKMEDYECCEHTFMPIDSSGEILSCTKCGTLIKRWELDNLQQSCKKYNPL